MNEWAPGFSLTFGNDEFERWTAFFRREIGRCGPLADSRLRHSLPLPDQAIDQAFASLETHMRQELTRCFPRSVVGRMCHSLLAYRQIAELFVPSMAEILLAQTKAEAWLYTDIGNPFYREHLVHPLAVAYVGQQILEEGGLFEQVRDATFSPRNQSGPLARFWSVYQCDPNHTLADISPQDKDRVLWAAWYVASACHDINQPYDLLNSVSNAAAHVRWWGLRFAMPHDLADHLDGHLWWEYLRWAVRQTPASDLDRNIIQLLGYGPTDPAAAADLLRRHCRLNHSTICALWIETVGRWVAEQTDHPQTRKLLQLVYEIAAAAVLTHDWVDNTDVYAVERFCDPDENPLGWVLLASDLLECWARPYRLVEPSDGDNPHLELLSRFIYPFRSVTLEIAESDSVVKLTRWNWEPRELAELFRSHENFLRHFCTQIGAFVESHKETSPFRRKSADFYVRRGADADPIPQEEAQQELVDGTYPTACRP